MEFSRKNSSVVRNVLCAMGVAVLTLAVTSCSSGSSGSSGTSSSPKGGSVSDLESGNWILTDASKLAPGASDVVVTARFDAGSMSGNSGCNSYNTSYKVSGSSLKIGPNIAGTQMACPPASTAVERAYLARLPRVAEYAIKGSTLTLTNSSGTTLLTYTESSGASALAGSWEVTGYYTGNAIQGPEAGTKLTAKFADPQVSGDAGCNTFTGSFTVDGLTIKIGPLAATGRACTPDSVEVQERQYLAALQAATTYAVAGPRLDLMRADGGFAVTFIKAAPAS